MDQIAQEQPAWMMNPDELIPRCQIPHLCGEGEPQYLLSNILASKACVIRRMILYADFTVIVQVYKYKDDKRCGLLRLELPPIYKPSEHRIPKIHHVDLSDLIICFQQEEDGTFKKPRWKTAIRHHYWDGAIETFIYKL